MFYIICISFRKNFQKLPFYNKLLAFLLILVNFYYSDLFISIILFIIIFRKIRSFYSKFSKITKYVLFLY